MPAKWQRMKIPVPPDFTPSEREEFGKQVAEYIRTRTESRNVGVPFGVAGLFAGTYKPFPRYTKDYTESLDFKNGGKSKGDIDLTLSGDMLAALDVISHKKGEVLIGYENGSDENARADGNIRGTYGQKDPDKSRARNFLGLNMRDYNRLLQRFKRER